MENINFDIVIIGAGIGGLITGIELARAGLHVAIFEQHSQPGGCCSSFTRKGFIFDAGAHAMTGLGNTKFPIGRYISKLKLNIDFVRIDPCDNIFFPEEYIEIPSNADKYRLKLKKNFPKEEHNIEAFFKEMRKIFLYSNKEESKTLEKYKDLTYQEMLNKFFDDEKLKSILSAQWGYLGLLPNKVSAITMSAMLASLLFYGAYYPIGGSGNFSNALAKKFQEFGGNLYLSHLVTKIIIKNNRVQGIVIKHLNREKEIKSKIVISNGDVKHTFFKLIDNNTIDSAYLNLIKNREESPSCFITYLGLDISKEKLIKKHGYYYNSYNINEHGNNPLWIAIPTNFDFRLAPKSKSIIQLYTTLSNLDESLYLYKRIKNNNEKTILNRFEKLFPNLKNSIIFYESATNITLNRYTLNNNGALYGWSAIPEQSWKNRLSNKTPIDNFYLVGHWTYPGAGIMSVISSGLIVSKIVLNRMKNFY